MHNMGAHSVSENKKKGDPSYKILPDGHPRIENQISEMEGKMRKKKILVRKQSNSNIRDELRFEKIRFITSWTDKRNKARIEEMV